MSPIDELLVSFFLLVGAVFAFIGSLGLARLRDVYSRLHGPTKATTLGVGGMLIASAVYFSRTGAGVSLHEVLVTLFLFITAPVSAHLLAKAALHLRLPNISGAPQGPASGSFGPRDHDVAAGAAQDVLRDAAEQ
ncbi:MAG: Na+/H+ antiporter subunit G [Gemmatimonadales bacterium]|nr:Na+/H+ antiporter subunit G [Gemmatimonadales bacterium]